MARMSDILRLERLPPLPAALARAIPLLLDPESDWDDLERVLRQDEALVAQTLRLANSGLYGASGASFDLRRALVRLGRDTLRRSLLETHVAGAVAGDNAAFGLERGALWRSALGGAIAAEELAREHAPGEAPLAFVCALLRDIGKLAINVRFGAGYVAGVCAGAREGRSFVEAEREAYGFDHAQVGGALARRWRLPERIARAIETHHEPPPPGPGHDPLFDIVHAADAVCRWAGLGVGVDGMEYALAEHVRTGLRLDRPAAEREIAIVWTSLREAEESLREPRRQGAAA